MKRADLLIEKLANTENKPTKEEIQDKVTLEKRTLTRTVEDLETEKKNLKNCFKNRMSSEDFNPEAVLQAQANIDAVDSKIKSYNNILETYYK